VSEPKRILHIIPSLDRAGAEKQMTMLVRGLPRDEFEVHVCALTRGGPMLADLQQAEIPVTVIGKEWRADPRAYWRLRRQVARLRPHLVQTWLFAANAYGRRAGLACGVKHVIACERCVDPWKGWLELAIDRYLARRTTRIVAVSQGVRDFYVRHGLPPEKFEIVHNAVPTARPVTATRRQILAELEFPEDSRLVGVVGRLWPQKQVKHAIWAADLLKVIRDDVHLLIIGDGPHRDRLRKFRDQVLIRDKVHFLGHRDDVWRIMPHLDALWSTSAYEGQSNSIMEAMAAGVPVIATDVPGTRDLIVDDQTGYLVPPDKACRREICRHTNSILDNPDLAQRLGEAGRQRMLNNFSVEKMVERYVQLYRQVLA
jgi:glycosyltransferase involved in cell wall biosynthesis